MTLHMRVSIIALFAFAACGDSDTKGKVEDTTPEVVDVIEIEAETVVFIETQDTQAEATSPSDSTVADSSIEPDARPDADGGEGCRTFGCSCTSNNGCLDELCIESADGNVCTRTCVADCPANFDCLAVTGFGDPVSVCVPRHTRLCRPCRTDAQCDDPGDPYPAYCLSDPSDDPIGATGSFCGSSCANRACPEGYLCQDTALTGGGTAKQCVPASGECTCRPSWSELGYSTDCAVTNVFGSCDGARSCTVNGLSACIGQQATQEICDNIDNDCDGTTDVLDPTPCMVQNGNGQCPGMLGCKGSAPTCVGPEPMAETCNGLDDNCNSATDENTCNDNLVCTADSCLNGSECAHQLIAGNCLVAGACYQAGGFNPQNSCEVCDPVKTQVAFSQSANTCVIDGQCYPPNTTNPTNACQICLPGQSATSWSAASNTCQIGGECYGGNQANPANPCEICSPVSSTTTWTQAPSTCNIQGQCYAAGFKDPNNDCVVCDPNRSATGWTNAGSNVSCDDANACSATSFCDGSGTCRGDTTCNDNIACTLDICDSRSGCSNDQVTPGQCRINGVCYGDGVANPTNPCERCHSGTSQTNWSPQPTTVACNDNLFCTTDDHCDGAGGCVGTTRTCGDALTCTADNCNESADRCENPLQANNCLISGACYANNATQNNNVCYKCNSGSSTSQWSVNDGATCNDGNNCTNNDTCSGGTCAGALQRDQYEINDASTAAYNLGDYTDGQNYPQRTITNPTISGSGDIDWYRYFVDDVGGGNIEPRVDISNVDPSLNIELCMYFRCTVGQAKPANLDCAGAGGTDGGTTTYGGQTYWGCCRNAAGNGGSEGMKFESTVNPFNDSEMECDDSDDDYIALVQIRSTNENYSCTNGYTMQIGDD